VKTIQIDTLPVEDVTFRETVDLLIGWAREGSGGYVTTPNIDHVVRAHGDADFRRDAPERLSPVLLQRLDQPLVDAVEVRSSADCAPPPLA